MGQGIAEYKGVVHVDDDVSRKRTLSSLRRGELFYSVGRIGGPSLVSRRVRWRCDILVQHTEAMCGSSVVTIQSASGGSGAFKYADFMSIVAM